MMLADAVQAADGKLYILGGGWNVSGQAPFGIALLLEGPWTEANQGHRWELHLQTEDGEPVAFPETGSIEPIVIGGDFEVGRPAGPLPRGPRPPSRPRGPAGPARAPAAGAGGGRAPARRRPGLRP